MTINLPPVNQPSPVKSVGDEADNLVINTDSQQSDNNADDCHPTDNDAVEEEDNSTTTTSIVSNKTRASASGKIGSRKSKHPNRYKMLTCSQFHNIDH